MKIKTINTFLCLYCCFLVGCKCYIFNESQCFLNTIRKDLPFRVDSIYIIDRQRFGFISKECSQTITDYEIKENGELYVNGTLINEPKRIQANNTIWRNIVFKKKDHRVVCVDRIPSDSIQRGYIYVLQTKTHKYPTYGTYHWDVGDLRNIEAVGAILEEYKAESIRRAFKYTKMKLMTQDDHWRCIFHGDSLYYQGKYQEAKENYDLAFSDKRFILPSSLSTVAKKMLQSNDYEAAKRYLMHRVQMEPDFYMADTLPLAPEINTIFKLRQDSIGYNLKLKEELEDIFEKDQYYRIQWSLALRSNPKDTIRNNKLQQIAYSNDVLNRELIIDILDKYGYPSKNVVGEFGSQAVWIVFQHSDLDTQEKYLPLLKEVAYKGDFPLALIAALEDRINVRKGNPQKYGTQIGPDGKVCKLLDEKMVNIWRKDVGLPPMGRQ